MLIWAIVGRSVTFARIKQRVNNQTTGWCKSLHFIVSYNAVYKNIHLLFLIVLFSVSVIVNLVL